MSRVNISITNYKTINELDKNKWQFVGYEYNGDLYDDLGTIDEVICDEIGGNYNNIDPQDTAEFEERCTDIDEVWEEMDVATQIVRDYIKGRK